MQQPAPTQPSPTFSDFAGLLARIASPPPGATENVPLWNDSDLGEDVAALSYERALRIHARYRPEHRGPGPAMPPANPGPDAGADAVFDAGGAAAEADARQSLPTAVAQDRNLRSASVTIRLSKAESARLHQRAAEADLTISAYLRSCALEAETLRAQVKQALAELKAGNKPPQPAQTACPPAARPLQGTKEQRNQKRERRAFFGWIRRLMKRAR
jgi:hypothetical protein